jgi:hypothetical protein
LAETDPTIPPVRWRAFVVAAVIYTLASTWLNLASIGFLEADGVTHFLYARFSFDVPAFLFDTWARPVRMWLHALPATTLGLHGVRAMSLLCVLLTAWAAIDTARTLRLPVPEIAGIAVLFSPLLFLHSASELTEVPFAMVLAFTIRALPRRNWVMFALLAGLSPMARPEGAAILLMAVGVLTWHRRWLVLPLVCVPLVAWNVAGWMSWGMNGSPWTWLIERFPYSEKSMYDSGRLTRFVELLPAIIGPALMPAVLIGGWVLTRAGLSRWREFAGQVCLLVVSIPVGILCVHSVLHFTGRMSSSGEPRYMLAAAPMWALLACAGWPVVVRPLGRRARRGLLIVGGLVPVIANFFYPVVPLVPQPDANHARLIADWFERTHADRSTKLITQHPMVLYWMDIAPGQSVRSFESNPTGPGVYVWHKVYSVVNADPSRTSTHDELTSRGWTEIHPGLDLPAGEWRFYERP